MNVRHLLSAAFALLCAIMIGLAAGAIWLVPILATGRLMPWLALPVGWILGRVVRAWVRPESASGAAILAVLAEVLAAIYLCALLVGLRIANALGFGFVDTLRAAGPDMLLSLARLQIANADLGWFLIGAVIAAVTAMRGNGKQR